MTALITSHPGYRYASFRERGEWRRVRAKCTDVNSANDANGPRSESLTCAPMSACAGGCSAAIAVVARTGEMFANLQKPEPPYYLNTSSFFRQCCLILNFGKYRQLKVILLPTYLVMRKTDERRRDDVCIGQSPLKPYS